MPTAVSDKVPNLRVNIREAIRLGKTQCTEIARFCSEPMPKVFNELRWMISDGELEKRRDGGQDFYEFAPQSKSPAGNPDFIKLNILKAVKANYRTLPWIKKQAGIEKATDISSILEELLFDKLLVRHTNTEITAFYLQGEGTPKTFWQKDDGTIHTEFEEKKEMENSSAATAKETIVETATAETTHGNKTRKRFEIDAEQLKKLAARGLSQKQIAASLGCAPMTLTSRLKESDELRRFYESGVQEYRESNPEPKKGASKHIDWSPVLLENLGAKFFALDDAAKSLGVSYSAIYQQVNKNKENSEAWKRGQKAYLETHEKPKPKTQPKAEVQPEPPPADVFIPKKCAECETEFVMETYLTEGENDFCNESCKTAFTKFSLVPNAPQIVDELLEAESRKEQKPEEPQFETKGFAGCAFCKKPFNTFPVHVNAKGGFCSSECVQAEQQKNLLKTPEVHTDERMAHTIKHISENGHSGESIERVKASVAAQTAVEVIPPPNRDGFNHFAGVLNSKEKVPDVHSHGKIEFSDGDALVCGFNGNFFQLSKKERGILNQMADLIQDYNEKEN